MIRIKRVYDPPEKSDGVRVIVDRLWPRGLTKERAKADLWMKDVAPSPALRTWFAHDPEKWDVFQKKYRSELTSRPAVLESIKALEKKEKRITLLFAAKDLRHNHALVLQKVLSAAGPKRARRHAAAS